jgi:hypothetical protein
VAHHMSLCAENCIQLRDVTNQVYLCTPSN